MFGIVKDVIRLLRIGIIRMMASGRSDIFTILSGSKVLIVAPHPDDEIIGCAGLMQSLLKAGKEVHIVILTGGEGSHKGCCSKSNSELIEARRDLAAKANKQIGITKENLYFLHYQDGNIHYEYQETEKLADLIKGVQPNSIFVPHKGEGWNDHLQVRNMIQKLIKNNSDIRLYEYCVWFWYYNTWNIDWKNAFTLSMTKAEHLLKNQAIDTYILPKAPCGNPWSGVLPKVFIKAARWNKELYFRIR